MANFCPTCGTENREGVTQCIACGAPLVSQQQPVIQMRYCVNCGKQMNAALPNCPFCGAAQVIGPTPAFTGGTVYAARHNRTSAALFAILLGSFGAHKFYLGQSGMGILYLLFCWTGIPTIVGVIEGIMYLSQSDMDFYRRYG